jgi:hypothetical protein
MIDSKSVAGAITDGSQAIAHDGFDVETLIICWQTTKTVVCETGAVREPTSCCDEPQHLLNAALARASPEKN